MAVSRVAITSGSPPNFAAFTPTLPTHAAGDRLTIILTGKYNTTTIPTVDNSWVLVASGTGGTGAAANDTGTMFWAVYEIIATSAAQTAPLITPGATNPNSWNWVAVSHRLGAGESWRDPVTTNSSHVQGVSDTDVASPLTGTASAWTGPPTAGDAIFTFGAIPTDAGTALGATTITVAGLTGGTKSTATSNFRDNTLGTDSGLLWTGWVGFTGTATDGMFMSHAVTTAVDHSGVLGAIAFRAQTGLTSVSTTRATTWDTDAVVSATKATTWDTRTEVATTKATTWATRFEVATSRATTWRVLLGALTTRTTSWDTRAVVSRASATTWRALGVVSLVRPTIWRTLASALTTRATTWDVDGVAAPVVTTRATTWRVLTSALATRATTWKTLGLASRAYATEWAVYEAVLASRSTTWVTRSTTARSLGATWGTRALVERTWTTTWDVAGATFGTVDVFASLGSRRITAGLSRRDQARVGPRGVVAQVQTGGVSATIHRNPTE